MVHELFTTPLMLWHVLLLGVGYMLGWFLWWAKQSWKMRRKV